MLNQNSRILVVDDMGTMRKIIINMLKDFGFIHFVEVSDADRAWEILATASPAIDMIISDVNMPGMSGVDFLKAVRSEPRFAKLPFIFLTSDADMKTV